MADEFQSESARRNRRFINAAMQAPLLSATHEHELATRWRDDGDETALHELVGAYLRLVIAVAGKFRRHGLPLAELVQEGSIGLMQAAARFDPGREVRFSTYASWWIRAAMQEYVLRNWSIVRSGTSAAQKSLFFNLRWMGHDCKLIAVPSEIAAPLGSSVYLDLVVSSTILARAADADAGCREPTRPRARGDVGRVLRTAGRTVSAAVAKTALGREVAPPPLQGRHAVSTRKIFDGKNI